MSIGLVGQKCGMTRIFTEDGASIPVSVIKVDPNRITQIKNIETDGYVAIQITIGAKSSAKITKPLIGHFAKANVEAGLGLWEFPLSPEEISKYTVASDIKADIFKEGDVVDVSGVTKGKGFAGVIKRHHFSMQDATHGNSLSHRAPGSIGQRQTPGRVFKGKRMAGHLGDVKRTVQNLLVVKVDLEKNLVFIKGGIPGAPKGYVIIKPAVKRKSER
jgi:large subunit ribosomal protein L3